MVVVKLVRYPRTRPTHAAMAKEVAKEYEALARDMERALMDMLGTGWRDKPDVQVEIKITKKRWMIRLKIDARTRAGRKFWWAAKGTGVHGPKHRAYLIRPRRAKALRFTVPHQPKTLPGTYYTKRARATVAAGELETVYSQLVVATGIRPRLFHKRLETRFNNRYWTGGFYRRSENAARRGLRRSNIEHVTVS
jgi:hypothetical protein